MQTDRVTHYVSVSFEQHSSATSTTSTKHTQSHKTPVNVKRTRKILKIPKTEMKTEMKTEIHETETETEIPTKTEIETEMTPISVNAIEIETEIECKTEITLLK